MKIRTPNIRRVEAFVRKIEIRRSIENREKLLMALTAPRLEHVYKERGRKAPMDMELKTSKMRREDRKDWAWREQSFRSRTN